MSGKLDGRSYAGTLKNFQSTHIGYRAHRAVIFAIAWHLVKLIIGFQFVDSVLFGQVRQAVYYVCIQAYTVTMSIRKSAASCNCKRRKKESRAIKARTARCRCKFRHVSNFTTSSRRFPATARLSCWSLSVDCRQC